MPIPGVSVLPRTPVREAFAARRRPASFFDRPLMTTYVFDVPEISCGHCKAAIEGEVGRLPDVARVEVDVAARQSAGGGRRRRGRRGAGDRRGRATAGWPAAGAERGASSIPSSGGAGPVDRSRRARAGGRGAMRPSRRTGRGLARWLSLADLAHAVALAEGGAIDAATAGRPGARAGLELDAVAPAEFVAARAGRRLQLARARAAPAGGGSGRRLG